MKFSSLPVPKVVKWQLLVQPMMKILTKRRPFRFSECKIHKSWDMHYLKGISAGQCKSDITRRNVLLTQINSLAPGEFEWNFRHAIFKQILVIDGWGKTCKITLIGMSLDVTDDQSTLVQVMAWCRQATSHYLGLCWPRSLLPYGVTRPQRVKAGISNGIQFSAECDYSSMPYFKWNGIYLSHLKVRTWMNN